MTLNIEDEERVVKKKEEEIEKITREELIETLKKLKRAKALGKDEIENEAWRFMSQEIGEELWKLINRIWKGEGTRRLEQRNNQPDIQERREELAKKLQKDHLNGHGVQNICKCTEREIEKRNGGQTERNTVWF